MSKKPQFIVLTAMHPNNSENRFTTLVNIDNIQYVEPVPQESGHSVIHLGRDSKLCVCYDTDTLCRLILNKSTTEALSLPSKPETYSHRYG